MVSRAKKNKKGMSEFFWELHPWEWLKRSRGKNEKLDMKKQVYPPPFLKLLTQKFIHFPQFKKKYLTFGGENDFQQSVRGGLIFQRIYTPEIPKWQTCYNLEKV